MAYGVAVVLDDATAEAAIAELAEVGDEEGSIAYDPEAEALLAGPAAVGMSGGGVFDVAGRHVGVLVRASTTDALPTQYVRVTRTAFARARLQAQLDALDTATRDDVLEYVEANG